MLAKLFNNISIQSLIRALFFSLLLLVAAWWLTDTGAAVLHILQWEWQLSEVGHKVLISGILLLVSIYLNSRINAIGFLKNDYQLIPVLMLMLTPVLFGLYNPGLLLALGLGTFLVTRLLELVQAVDPSYILFDSGVLLGLMVLLVPESAFFLLIIWLATLNFGHLTIRTFLMPVIGVSAIYFLLFALLYWIFDLNALALLVESLVQISLNWDMGRFSRFWVFLPLLVIMAPALMETSQVYGKASVKKRQVFTFLTLFLLLMGLAGLFIESAVDLWIWLLLPAGIFIVNLLHYLRKGWHRNVVYLFLVLFFVLGLLF